MLSVQMHIRIICEKYGLKHFHVEKSQVNRHNITLGVGRSRESEEFKQLSLGDESPTLVKSVAAWWVGGGDSGGVGIVLAIWVVRLLPSTSH